MALFLVMNEISLFAQGTTVWHWVPNPQQGYLFPDPLGAPVNASPFFPVSGFPIDMTGNGTVDFEFRVRETGPVIVEVLQHSTNNRRCFDLW
jgi:hypothetical protein